MGLAPLVCLSINFVGVIILRDLLLGVYIRAHCFWKLPVYSRHTLQLKPVPPLALRSRTSTYEQRGGTAPNIYGPSPVAGLSKASTRACEVISKPYQKCPYTPSVGLCCQAHLRKHEKVHILHSSTLCPKIPSEAEFCCYSPEP